MPFIMKSILSTLILYCYLILLISLYCDAKSVKFTYYWIAFEDEYPEGSDASIRNCNGGIMAKTSSVFAKNLKLECSGRLRNGKYVNGGDKECSCFNYSPPVGSKGNKLVPFISIAANDIPFGTKIMVKQMKGLKLQNGKTHNGCVRMDDVSWSFGGNHIDWYVLRKVNYEKLISKIGKSNVDIQYPSNCQLLKY